MHRTILILTLTLMGTLALTTLCEAGPRGRIPAELHPELGNSEHRCLVLGQMAYDQARGRDSGISYLQMLTIVRGLSWSSTAMAPWLPFVEANLRIIYEDPRVTPVTTRNQTEIVCLDMSRRAQQSSPTLAKDRY
jgi:hypothetical protein